ncbi:efflux RND transporter periplasmic adaptor subunit [Paradesertivirga mongoliensis]|uniref:Efflux RND transporter periplasmic adaptor subunit n=1 Tax=Paradesertivirga mongoliensis TaxID=2100740 RepID=A0ABW4ZLT5_9SPHI|nr:efflux RND transporter periplasmic adaptor subunit [Pedobacter mongoliensis]
MKHIIYLAVILVIAACGKPKDKKAELAELKKNRIELDKKIAALEKEVGVQTVQEVADVAVLEVVPATFKSFLEIQGRVDAQQNVQVNPEAPGVITGIYVTAGQRVSRGQVLAQLDDKVLRQSISQLQSQLELANSLYRRQKNLWDQKIGTEVQFLTAKSQKEGLERQIGVLRSQQSMYKMKSPISGTVDKMDLKLGQAVSPGMPGITVVNTSDLKVEANVAESYAGRVNQGDEVEVILPDVPDSLKTKVTYASRVIDPVSRSFNIEIKLPARNVYRPNMLAVLRIVDYKINNAITVPVNAIQKSETADYVFVAENGKAKRVNVRAGKVSEGKAEILVGLKAGDKVVISGMQDLNEGESVKF